MAHLQRREALLDEAYLYEKRTVAEIQTRPRAAAGASPRATGTSRGPLLSVGLDFDGAVRLRPEGDGGPACIAPGRGRR